MCHGEARFCKIYYPMTLVLMLSAPKKNYMNFFMEINYLYGQFSDKLQGHILE